MTIAFYIVVFIIVYGKRQSDKYAWSIWRIDEV